MGHELVHVALEIDALAVGMLNPAGVIEMVLPFKSVMD